MLPSWLRRAAQFLPQLSFAKTGNISALHGGAYQANLPSLPPCVVSVVSWWLRRMLAGALRRSCICVNQRSSDFAKASPDKSASNFRRNVIAASETRPTISLTPIALFCRLRSPRSVVVRGARSVVVVRKTVVRRGVSGWLRARPAEARAKARTESR